MDLAPTWTSDSDQLKLQLALISTYTALDKFANKSKANSTELSSLLTKMTVPYLYNSFEKQTSDPQAWYMPGRLILDLENPTATHHLVSPKLAQFRGFLTAAGVREMVSVDYTVTVAAEPNQSEFSKMLRNVFESQDRANGFMDVCFRFDSEGGRDIYAHKIVLAHWSEFFRSRFLGIWGKSMIQDPSDPVMQIVDMSVLAGKDKNFYGAFWGLLHYLYTHKLTRWNEPPTFTEDNNSTKVTDDLAERVQYLLALLALADEYQIDDEYQILRLKDLIAYELVVDNKVLQGNVFDVRKHATLHRCKPIVEYCEIYIQKNAESLRSFEVGEIAAKQEVLNQGGQGQNGGDLASMRDEVVEHRENLEVIAKIAAHRREE